MKIQRPLELVIVRHAESSRNKAKKGATYFADDEARSKLKGIPDQDIPITSTGLKQAQITGINLRQRFVRPDYVFNSGYVRTVHTMDNILSAFTDEERISIKTRTNPFITERNPGYTYDMTEEEAERYFPYLKDHWTIFGGFFATPPGGESLHSMATRVYLFLNKLFRDHKGQRVWIITHGGTIRVLRFILEKWSYAQALKWPPGQSPKNCGVTVYSFDTRVNRLVLREYNTIFYDRDLKSI